MLQVRLAGGRVRVEDARAPRRPRGFATIRLLIAGICNTDLELQRGYYGFEGVPGHEFVGEVIAADTQSLVGKRVVGEINLACGKCAWCARDLGRHCPSRKVLGIVEHPGAFRELLTLPEENLHVVPASLSDEEAVFVEPLAAACEILDQVAIARGTRVALLGDGKLGLLIAQVLLASGAEVVHFGKHREKLALSARAGATVELIGATASRTGKHLPRASFPLVIDASGSPRGLALAIALCEPRGTLVLKSTVHGLVPLDTAPVIVNELTLVGSRCGRFEPALKLLARRAVDVASLVSERFALADAPRAFSTAAQRGVLKVLLDARG